jgi:hypothetical protein
MSSAGFSSEDALAASDFQLLFSRAASCGPRDTLAAELTAVAGTRARAAVIASGLLSA